MKDIIILALACVIVWMADTNISRRTHESKNMVRCETLYVWGKLTAQQMGTDFVLDSCE